MSTASELPDELRRLGKPENRAGMARYGINVDNAHGVPVAQLRVLAKRIGRDALRELRSDKVQARLAAKGKPDCRRIRRLATMTGANEHGGAR